MCHHKHPHDPFRLVTYEKYQRKWVTNRATTDGNVNVRSPISTLGEARTENGSDPRGTKVSLKNLLNAEKGVSIGGRKTSVRGATPQDRETFKSRGGSKDKNGGGKNLKKYRMKTTGQVKKTGIWEVGLKKRLGGKKCAHQSQP